MIPSTTKLVLLYTILHIIPDAEPMPKRVYQSQEGEFNLRADLKDIGIVLLPDKGMVDSAINIVVGKGGGSRQMGADRVKSKYGYARPEKSPYKVDLEKSTVPLVKVDSLPETKKAEAIVKELDNKTVKKDLKPAEESNQNPTDQEKKEVVVNEEKKDASKQNNDVIKDDKYDEKKEEKDVKKDTLSKDKEVKKETLPKKDVDKKESERVDKEEATTRQKGMKMQGQVDTLILIHEGIEDCGPDGHRNQEGICMYTVT